MVKFIYALKMHKAGWEWLSYLQDSLNLSSCIKGQTDYTKGNIKDLSYIDMEIIPVKFQKNFDITYRATMVTMVFTVT